MEPDREKSLEDSDPGAVEESKAEPQATESEPRDKYLVDFEENDARNPLNWPSGKKSLNIAVLSAYTFVSPLASSMFAPGVPAVLQEFGSSSTLLAGFVVSVYLIGYAAGPLLCAPLSETYGRLIVYQVTSVLFVAFTLACAFAPSLNSLIGFRFLAGSAGSAPLILGAGSIADMYVREERGGKMAIFAIGPLLGPVAGPVAGAFLAEYEGWRWVFRLIAILAGVVTIGTLSMQETYSPVLLERETQKLRKSTGDPNYRSKMAIPGTPGQLLIRAFIRPTKMTIRSPTVALFTLYMSVVYGYMYLLFTTITEVYEYSYGFSTGIAGLSFLGIGIGMMTGLVAFGATSDRRIRNIKAKGKEAPAEVRLEALVPAAIFVPIGLFWYGWSADKQIHWIMPIIGTGFVGLGVIGMFMGIQTYLIDCFPIYAAAVTAANTVMRSLVGALLPLAGQPLYQNLGLGWGNSLLGFIALAMVPLPFVFLKYGERIRTSPRFQVEF